MRDVNGWLMAMAFLLGLLLTLAMMVRRVTREVPVNSGVEKTVAKAVHPRDVKADYVLEKEPYGAGSTRVSARSAAPAGYTVKGDKDTGRYFTLDSPEYAAIEAEVWFANEASAAKAGFLRWDAEGDESQRR